MRLLVFIFLFVAGMAVIGLRVPETQANEPPEIDVGITQDVGDIEQIYLMQASFNQTYLSGNLFHYTVMTYIAEQAPEVYQGFRRARDGISCDEIEGNANRDFLII